MKRKWMGRGAIVVTLALVLVALAASSAFAGEDPKPVFDGANSPVVSDVGVSLNLLWVVIGAVLVTLAWRWWQALNPPAPAPSRRR